MRNLFFSRIVGIKMFPIFVILLLFLRARFRARNVESSVDGCIWVDSLGCELGYGGECTSYLTQVDGTLVNTVDLTYYETLCRTCWWFETEDECESVEECVWDGAVCMYPKKELQAISLTSEEYHNSLIFNEIQSHAVCSKIKEEDVCLQTQSCLWSADKTVSLAWEEFMQLVWLQLIFWGKIRCV